MGAVMPFLLSPTLSRGAMEGLRSEKGHSGLIRPKLRWGYHKGNTPMIWLQEGNKGGHKRLHGGDLPRSSALAFRRCHGRPEWRRRRSERVLVGVPAQSEVVARTARKV